MIRTLVADDSPAFREALTAVLREDPEFHVLGGAADGAVVVMSRLMDTGAQQVAFEALRAGAVEVMGKPRDLRDPKTKDALRQLLKAMATVKVVRHRKPKELSFISAEAGLLAIGASTGGPPAL